MTSCKYFLAAESDTVTAGTCLAAACGEKGLVVFLYGDLGAGKVNISAIGSCMLISATPYQLAFFKPGTSPRIAASRNLIRLRPNLRR